MEHNIQTVAPSDSASTSLISLLVTEKLQEQKQPKHHRLSPTPTDGQALSVIWGTVCGISDHVIEVLWSPLSLISLLVRFECHVTLGVPCQWQMGAGEQSTPHP